MAVLAGACGFPEDEGSSTEEAPEVAEEPTAVETVQIAYRETTAERAARISYEATTTSPPVEPEDEEGPAPMVLTLRGAGVTNFSGTEFAMTMNMLGMGGFEMRRLDGMVYTKPPEDFRPPESPDTKPWIRVSADEAYKESGPSLMGAEEAQDPARQLEYLRGVSDSVEKAGVEEVRGVRTTRYKVVVDLNKEAAGQDNRTRKEYDQMIGQLGTSKAPVEVWIDDQNLARRVAMDMIVPGYESSAAPGEPGRDDTRLSMVTEYYDFGVPVDVQAPPQDQTMDGSELLSDRQPATQ
jgi:hypothetical protein